MDEGFRTWIATFDEHGRDTVIGWIALLICVAIGVYLYSIGTTALWHAMKYSVSPGRVHVDPKPTDCDFWRAPIGLKSCHYDELVVTRPADEWVGNVRYLQVYVS